MNLRAQSNDYVEAVGESLIDRFPKAVLAAIAISALTCGGDTLFVEDAANAKRALVKEWQMLHDNGIVPQAVPAALRAYLSGDEA